ncbi:MAG: Gfo/Idh/MocA family oxidoreductase [Clostridiales bacterium]|nr:Gfo/Idh/MocA family oxidoreductase [Clostridiales bacterium]MBP5417621.1 Gfo/Idh/MocA family oxidoreductase [Clostridiales bacterium]
MQDFRVCFVGVGSIAKRHIKNLRAICPTRGLNITIDAYRRSSSSYEAEGVDRVFTDLKDMEAHYDAVFITNPTEYHLDALRSFHEVSDHFFIEKPLVSLKQLDSASGFPFRKDAVYYVACPLRYNAVIQYIAENIDVHDVISVRSISSSYLPDWRPGQDYRDTYSAHKDLGGGVSIDLIHEWDYLSFLFGKPLSVKSLIGKKSPLEIDSDDYAIYIGEYKDRIVELHLDYFGRKTIRRIELFTKNDTIVGDLVSNTISFLVEGKTIDFHEERDDFQKRELNHFLDVIYCGKENDSSHEHAVDVLKLTQGDV